MALDTLRPARPNNGTHRSLMLAALGGLTNLERDLNPRPYRRRQKPRLPREGQSGISTAPPLTPEREKSH